MCGDRSAGADSADATWRVGRRHRDRQRAALRRAHGLWWTPRGVPGLSRRVQAPHARPHYRCRPTLPNKTSLQEHSLYCCVPGGTPSCCFLLSLVLPIASPPISLNPWTPCVSEFLAVSVTMYPRACPGIWGLLYRVQGTREFFELNCRRTQV